MWSGWRGVIFPGRGGGGVVRGLEVSLGKLLEHGFIELSIGQQSLEAGVPQLECLEALVLCRFHAAVELLPAVVGRFQGLQDPAYIVDAMTLVEELLSSAQIADNL